MDELEQRIKKGGYLMNPEILKFLARHNIPLNTKLKDLPSLLTGDGVARLHHLIKYHLISQMAGE